MFCILDFEKLPICVVFFVCAADVLILFRKFSLNYKPVTVGDVRKEEPTPMDIDIAELERRAGDTATQAIKGYNRALYALKNYNADIEQVLRSISVCYRLNYIFRL